MTAATLRVACFVVCLAVVRAELPVPETFRGYERGGYEIKSDELKTFPGADQLNFPGASDVTGSQPSGSSEDFLSSQQQEAAPVGGSSGQQIGSSRFQGGDVNDVGEEGGQQRGSRRFQGGEGDAGQQRGSSRFQGGKVNDISGRDEEGDEGSLDDIPGVPGKDYPIYGQIPKTSFSCDQQLSPGYYADIETQCQVFHICQKGGQMNSVLCPNGTVFNQRVFVCSWWYDFDCDSAQALFALNAQVNAEGEAATSKAGRRGGVQGSSLGGDQSSRESLQNGGYEDNGPRPAKITDSPDEGEEVNEIGGRQNIISSVGSASGHHETDLASSDGYPREGTQSSLGNGEAGAGGLGYHGGRGGDRSRFAGRDGERSSGEEGYTGGRGGSGGGGARDSLVISSGGGVAGEQVNAQRNYLPPT